MEKLVSLPEEKWLKYFAKVSNALEALEGGKKISCKAAISLSGTLSHIAFVYPHSHAYLSNLYTFVARFGPHPSDFLSCW